MYRIIVNYIDYRFLGNPPGPRTVGKPKLLPRKVSFQTEKLPWPLFSAKISKQTLFGQVLKLLQTVCFMGPKQTFQPEVCFYLRKVSLLKFVLQVWSSCFGGFRHIAGQSHGSTLRLHHAWAHMALPNASTCISLNWLRHRPPCCWSLLFLVLPLFVFVFVVGWACVDGRGKSCISDFPECGRRACFSFPNHNFKTVPCSRKSTPRRAVLFFDGNRAWAGESARMGLEYRQVSHQDHEYAKRVADTPGSF